MRTILLFLAGCLLASAASDYPAATLHPGDAVKSEALAALTYLRGNGPARWEQDKVYIIDCWATWCVPSKTIIPRLNKLHADYQAKGLRVIGVSVFGEDK
ncbi:MAG: TlpA disulfide reductase family protein, partial [Verrucomicrobia bacterium]|nr:TlpA disulfide reductase family protein [Verrucomicrobiota bacterium]